MRKLDYRFLNPTLQEQIEERNAIILEHHEQIKEEVYKMSKKELQKELLKYKFREIDGVLLHSGLNGLTHGNW